MVVALTIDCLESTNHLERFNGKASSIFIVLKVFKVINVLFSTLSELARMEVLALYLKYVPVNGSCGKKDKANAIGYHPLCWWNDDTKTYGAGRSEGRR